MNSGHGECESKRGSNPILEIAGQEVVMEFAKALPISLMIGVRLRSMFPNVKKKGKPEDAP